MEVSTTRTAAVRVRGMKRRERAGRCIVMYAGKARLTAASDDGEGRKVTQKLED